MTAMVVTVKSIKRTFVDFIDVFDGEESNGDFGIDNAAACTWPVSCLRMPSDATDSLEGQRCDSEGDAGSEDKVEQEADVEEERDSGVEEPKTAEDEEQPQFVLEASPAEESTPVAKSTPAPVERVKPFIILESLGCASMNDTSQLTDADISSPMWTWHNDTASFYGCSSLEWTMPAAPGPAVPALLNFPRAPEYRRPEPALREPRFIPQPPASAPTTPTTPEQSTDDDSVHFGPPASLPEASGAARALRSDRPCPAGREQRQQQRRQQQIHRADPNRLERRRHPARKRDDDADTRSLDSGEHTTIMIRNVPNNYTRDMLLQLLRSRGFGVKCDFVYMPIDFHTQSNLGYAFVNLESAPEARRFWQLFDGFSRWAVRSKKVASLRWSECQGLEANIKRYRNSPVMGDTVPDCHKPIVFCKGIQVQFPPPSKPLRAPRIKQLGFK